MSDCIKGKDHDFESNEFSDYCANGCGENWANYTIMRLGSKIKELEEREKKLIDCVEFYIDSNNFTFNDGEILEFIEIGSNSGFNLHGDKARQTLKELGISHE